MPVVLKASEATGKCAIYTVSSLADPVTTDPLTSPSANASVLHFHSDWYYPAIVGADHTGSATIPAAGANTFQNGTLTLFAHGMGDPPMVFGQITVGANTLEIAGDVSLERTSSGNPCWTWASLEVDATNVYLRYYGAVRSGSGGVSSLTFSYNVKVADWLTTGSVPSGSSSDPVFLASASGGYVKLGRGRVDSRKRYFKQTGAGSSFRIIRGETIQMIRGVNALNAIQTNLGNVVWGYALAGYESPAIFSTDITINPTYTSVKV